MTKTEIKEKAQNLMLDQIENTYYIIEDLKEVYKWSDEEVKSINEEVRKQIVRIEKLFGFTSSN